VEKHFFQLAASPRHALSTHSIMFNTTTARHHDSFAMRALPLVTLYLTERCNSRCVTCDYWRHGRADMSLASVSQLLPALASLGTREVLISGGEPLIHPEWAAIAGLLKAQGLRLSLLSSGVSLLKHAQRVVQLFDSITVSLDGTNRETYAAIRGLDAFDNVTAGVRAAVDLGAAPTLRTTIQRANYRELPQFVTTARQLGARQISFLAADVSNLHAFGRHEGFSADAALLPDDLPRLRQVLSNMEHEHAEHYRSGFIAESPGKMQRLLQYYAAICGAAAFPPTRCNAPDFSAVVAANGSVNPCFFIKGTAATSGAISLGDVLNNPEMTLLRKHIRDGQRDECRTCVCTMWRDAVGSHAEDVARPRQVAS
jgi:radical SAM protein with 4Fe4S-binding SPASM domain